MKHPKPAPKRCPYCGDYYTPYIRAAKTQKSCGKAACRKKRQKEAYKSWTARNPGYFRGRYLKVKRWLADRPGYQRAYRAANPGYAVANNAGQRRRRKKLKRFRTDIQNGLIQKVDGLLGLLSG
jgi:RNA recognition motif-containing protein